MGNRKYDFAGWVTKHDTKCADGVTIKHDAFKDNDGQKVPLVWNHDYNTPDNVLGHVVLEHRDNGVYGYGYFNETQSGDHAKAMVKHGDVSSMSIGARKIKRSASNIIHGLIYEVSLVLSGANPGALIDEITHSDTEGLEEMRFFTGTLIHSADDIIEHKEEGTETKVADEETIGDVIDTMNDKQKDALYALLGAAADFQVVDEENDDDKKGDDDTVKQNVFSKGTEDKAAQDTLKHGLNEILIQAKTNGVSSLRDLMLAKVKENSEDDTIQHGINSIEMLFPEAHQSTNGNTPILYKDPNTGYEAILNATSKSPFSKVRTLVADLTQEEARAKGYIKGTMKKEQFFSLIKRFTGPTTVYKKQKLDRDDIIDITDFNVVSFMQVEMKMMLKEEIARALLVGDGREVDDEDKISEESIRPVISDNEFFTIKKTFGEAADFTEAVILAMAEYRGSGLPSMYIDPTLLAQVKLLKGTDGRYLFGDIPSDAAVATRLGLSSIVPTTFMVDKGALIVNLKDYTLGASKGGEITNFDDFDIDFNQHKYLTETRLSGSLTLPKSAIHMSKTASTGASREKAGMVYGKRQEDKTNGTEGEE